MSLHEMNFDGLVGLTHNYAGLSLGNLASRDHGGQTSHPRAAALQGLDKMRNNAAMGIPQGFLPPLLRPDLSVLRSLGFEGDDAKLLAHVQREDPVLLAQVSSASCMWTANAATVSPSTDTADGRVHFTPANLRAQFHRAIEPVATGALLSRVFPDPELFTHHAPLPPSDQYGDEGAANHTRLETDEGVVHLFVYGVEHRQPDGLRPTRFPARQTREASEAIGRRHGLAEPMFVQQSPGAIDLGIFHNDVISVGTGRLLLVHEQAFVDTTAVLDEIRRRLGPTFHPLVVTAEELPVEACVTSYLFNSQLLELPDGSMTLIAPGECRTDERVRRICDSWVDGDSPIGEVVWMDVRESMQNGGGPACLRLRVPLTDSELDAVHPGVVITEESADRLQQWIETWYPESLDPRDLADPTLLRRTRDAHDALREITSIDLD